MTSEVIVMNKNGLGMAADSAAVLMPKRKTFLRQNKIFPLTHQEPIGIMINERLRLNGVPWETIIKAYYVEEGHKTFDHLEAYLKNFLHFIQSHEFLFDHTDPEYFWVCDVLNYLENLEYKIKTQWRYDTSLSGQNLKLDDYTIYYIEGMISELQKTKKISPPKFNLEIENYLKTASPIAYEQSLNLIPMNDQNWLLLKKLISLLSDRDEFSLGHSQVIIAGFGNKDFLPLVTSVQIAGLYFRHLKHKIHPAQRISKNNQAQIIPFASTETVTSFLKGAHPAYEQFSIDILYSLLDDIFETHVKAGSKNDFIEKHLDTYIEEISGHVASKHILPIIEGITFLSTQELSSVAESLVKMAHFKTSVAPGQNYIGGDIDVASITKGDGFEWVKNKTSQYNDPTISSIDDLHGKSRTKKRP